MRHQHRERHLPHVGRLAAHVGAGDEQQAARRRQPAVVGDETVDLSLDHRVAASLKLDQAVLHERRAAVIAFRRDRGKAAQDVDLRKAARDPLQDRHMDLQRLKQLLVERFLERQGAVAGGQGLVLERLQLRRDVTLGVLQRLPAAVVVRHFARVRVRHFEVVAVHLVVGDAQVGNSRALALADLQRHQKVPGVGLQLAQLIEVGAVSVGDHAAVDHAGRGLDVEGFLQEANTSAGQREIGSQLVEQARMRCRGDQVRQQLQALAQPGELAGPHAAQRDPGGDPLDVGHAAQDLVKTRIVQRCDSLVPARQHGAVPQRVMQPETKEPAAHAGRAFVEQREQGRRRLAAQCLGELEIAARRRI